jgi:hypothetical protein
LADSAGFQLPILNATTFALGFTVATFVVSRGIGGSLGQLLELLQDSGMSLRQVIIREGFALD